MHQNIDTQKQGCSKGGSEGEVGEEGESRGGGRLGGNNARRELAVAEERRGCKGAGMQLDWARAGLRFSFKTRMHAPDHLVPTCTRDHPVLALPHAANALAERTCNRTTVSWMQPNAP